MVGMVAGRVVEEANLLTIPTAPFAKEEMYPQANSLDPRQFPIKSLRLKAACLLAIGRKQSNHSGKGFHQINRPFIRFLAI
jgi:hypothetical protein